MAEAELSPTDAVDDDTVAETAAAVGILATPLENSHPVPEVAEALPLQADAEIFGKAGGARLNKLKAGAAPGREALGKGETGSGTFVRFMVSLESHGFGVLNSAACRGGVLNKDAVAVVAVALGGANGWNWKVEEKAVNDADVLAVGMESLPVAPAVANENAVTGAAGGGETDADDEELNVTGNENVGMGHVPRASALAKPKTLVDSVLVAAAEPEKRGAAV